MKTKVKRLSKRTLALMLCFLMMISAVGLGTLITANAASSTYTVYFRNNGNWSNVYVLTGSNLNMSGSSGAYENLYGSGINGFTQMTKVEGETNVYKASVTVYDNKIAFASANSTQSGYYASSGQICCVRDMTSGKICNMWTDSWTSRNGAAYKKYNLEDYTPPTSKTFYIYNKDNWSTVKYYTYNGNEAAGSWPGTTVNKSTAKIGTHEGHDVYSVTLTTRDTHIILNNGSGIQTKGDSQTSLTDDYVYSTVTSGNSTASTVYTSTSNLGLDKTISYTLGSNVNKGSTFVTNGIDNNTSAKTGTITAYYNKNVALSVTYASNYEYDSSNSSLGGATASNGNKTFTFSAVTADKTISINAKASNTALAAPTGVSLSSTSVTASENSKVTLSWNSVTNAGSYEIYKDGSKVGTSTTSSYSIERGYSYGGSYTVKAVPSDTALYSTSVASSAVTLTVTKVTLAAPTVTPSATEINYGGSVTFNLTNNNTSYTEGTDFSYKRTTAGGSTYSYTVSNLSYDTGAVKSTGTKTYKFKAVALKSDYFADSTEVSKSFTVSQAGYYLTGDLVGLGSWPKDNKTKPVNTFVSNNIYSYAVTTTTTGNHYFSLTNGSGTRYQPNTSDTDMSSHNTAETAVTASTTGDWGSMYVTGVGNFIIYVNQATSGSPKVWVVKGSVSNNVTFPSSVTGQYTVQYSGQTKSYDYDDDVSFTVTPATGYRIKSVTYTPSGGSATAATTGSNNTYSFKMPAAACTISVTAVRTYTVSLTAGTGFATKQYKIGSSGTYADYSSSITVDSGSVVYFKVTYSDGYEYDSNTNLTVDTANTVFKTSAITADTSASLTAKKSTYNITKSVTPSTYASNVTVDSTGQYNDSKSVSVTVPSGYTLGSVTANSTSVTMSGTTGTVTGTFTMPAAAVTLTVTFTAKTQTVAYTAKCGDSTIKTYTSRTVSVPAGETVTADATLTVSNVKYTFSSWQYSGLSGTPTVNNTARTITYNPVEDSNSGSITAVYTEVTSDLRLYGRFQTDAGKVDWGTNDTNSPIKFTKTSSLGVYKLETGKTATQLRATIDGNPTYFCFYDHTTKNGFGKGGTSNFYSYSASNKLSLDKDSNVETSAIKTTVMNNRSMQYGGTDTSTQLVIFWVDIKNEKAWCTTAAQTHSVTFPANGTGYTISNAGTTVSYNYGDTVTFDVTPATGYGIDSVTWAGSSESGTATNTSGNTYTFTMPNEDVTTITVTASEVPYESAKNVTYYIDFHDNTLSANPTIKFGSNAAVALTKVTSYNGANIYSATVSTPYYYYYITGNANTAIEDIDAVINANGNDYDITIDKSVIHSGECECWIESQGTVDTTTVPTTRHTVSNSTDTKRIYLHKKDNTTWYGNWVDVYMYYKKQDGTQYSGVEWGSTNAVQKMNYLSKIDNYYVYYLDVPEDAFYFKPYGKNNGTTHEMKEMGDQIEMYGNNELYLNDDDNNRWSYGNSAVAPFISDYYDTVTIQNGNSTSVAPTATGTVTYSYTGSTYYTLYTNGSITAKAQGSGTVTITATGTYGDTVTAQTSVTVKNASVTGDFSVMSYDSISTTLNSGDGVTIDSVSTKLYGTKANGSTSAIVNGGGIVTKSGNNFTATYAAPEASTGYGSLAMRVTASVTPDGDDYYFDGWYKGGNEKSTVYTSENDDIRVDGYNYTLNFSQIDTYTVTITYNYKEYTAGGAYSDSGATTNKTYTPDSIKFRGDITTDDCKELAVENCPNLISDYFNYRLITGNTSGYAFSASINTTNKTATVTAYLKESARKYKVYVDGTKFGNKTYTYQEEVELRAGEVGYDDDTNLNWYEGTKRMATGTSYNIRVTGDTELTTSVNSALENNNGKSIISYKSHELMLDTNGVQKLTQNFYIADFCNAELGGEDGEANFVGGGVLYYAVDKTTGKATKATANSKGEASESTLRSAVENVVNGNYNSDLAKDTADSASKITCRYKKLEGNEGIYKFSSDLQAYQYIYSSTMTNNKAYENYTYRVYSYFVYEVNGEYHISVSDSYADADFYVAE